ncbi:3-hydroxy-3-methylglutaryl-CoA reductase [Xylogone sp. PMI_703]|nr:3-hydroxy-3-methylglutaryl-CoA reductase [Xylogone sp. PMI_703]
MSSLIPSHFRSEQPSTPISSPPWINRKITSLLQVFSRITSSHPIHTVVIVALLASSSYIGLLEDSFFGETRSLGKADWSSLVEGSKRLRAGPETAWEWQTYDSEGPTPENVDHLALLTLVFPGSKSDDICPAPPVLKVDPFHANISVTSLPSTSNSFASYSQETTLTFSVPYAQAPNFLSIAQEIPDNEFGEKTTGNKHGREEKMWIMRSVRAQTRTSLVKWAQNAWVEFLELVRNAETTDIITMIVGYISMHLTFVSLFLSMRRMGSNFWLAGSVMLSSFFAFLFGLLATSTFGVPLTMVLLSEGLPFLVVIVGFEKNIVLTRAVLSHAVEHRKSSDTDTGKPLGKGGKASNHIQSAIQLAISEKGFDIVRDYAVDICILAIGAASGIQGGLQQFCFFAAWILFFDCILLFSFYTAILYIKLEISRIRRHVETRKALEDDGVSHRVAENVARSNDWPQDNDKDQPGTTIFGRQIKSTHVSKFKIVMVVGFFLINAFNFYAVPFRSARSSADPFKVASNGLDTILDIARMNRQETVVTVLAPIRYELEFPSIHYDLLGKSATGNEGVYADLRGYGVGGRVVGSVLKSLEGQILSKCIVVALALSVALNGYLFSTATAGIKDPNGPEHPIDPEELAQAQAFNDIGSSKLPLGGYIGPPAVLTPALSDDEEVVETSDSPLDAAEPPAPLRSRKEMEKMLQEKRAHELNDEEVIELSMNGKIPSYALEKTLKDFTRAVKIRRAIIARTKATADLTSLLQYSKLPYKNYNWAQVFGACCENVVGYMPVPVGLAGPLVIDGRSYFIPMATTEGVLVASTSRGCKAINSGGGAVTVLTADGMTRGPCVSFENLERAGAAKIWLDSEKGQTVMKKAFNSTSRFARLQSLKTVLAGTNLFLRFKTTTGDAMGMNMISKGVEHALSVMMDEGFEDMNLVSISGNYCTDKKAAAINWIDGRGKSVVAEAIIPADAVRSILKTDVDTMVELNVSKNLIGSAMAGAIGGFNAHAANIVAALFIATGQDPAQVVESANCITIMRK